MIRRGSLSALGTSKTVDLVTLLKRQATPPKPRKGK
jgi:hypothetical protein